MATGQRKPWVGGNWKCNCTTNVVDEIVERLNKIECSGDKLDIIVSPPAVYLPRVKSALCSKRYHVCAQNVSKTGMGAFTGEVCIEQLKDIGCCWTLVGHSERRQYYGETDCVVADKVAACQKDAEMKVAICIGELLEERQGGKMEEVVKKQMEAVIPKITDWSRVVIAYEPVWAIGTGVTASPEQAQEAHDIVRKLVAQKTTPDIAKGVRIVYGGSVNAGNAATLIGQPDIDGFLVGGASLKPEFATIIEAVCKSC